MDSSISKKTQETLGKVIKKPPLTDKLLGKPPFRFLHDIITEVVKNTGFFKGLYAADEMNSANVKEKDAKIAFLQKAIDVVVIVSGSNLAVRPSKIVAGHEPEKTNEFLQTLAKAIIAKKSSSEAVKNVLSGGKSGKADAKKKDRSSSRDREKSKEKESDKKDDKKKDSAKGSSDRKKREDSGKKDKEKEEEKKSENVRERSREKEKHKEKAVEKEKPSKKQEELSDTIDTGQSSASPEDSDFPPNRIPRPTSAKGQRRRPADGDGDELEAETNGLTGTDASPIPTEQMNGVLSDEHLPQQITQSRRMPRPSSSRPAPPKIKKQQEDLDDQVGRIGSGKQVTSVIVDDGKDQDDDDEIFVVEDPNAMSNHVDSTPSNDSLEPDVEHGGLVRKILETKKELEGSNEQQGRQRQDKSTPIISDAAHRKERELAQKEIEKLRNSIQTLTRSANPLGKIMDYVQEDVDSMNKELEMWRTENRTHSIALKREQSITDNEIEPLRGQLEELDSEINDMVDRISTVKCNILKNDERIQKMLSSISFNSR